MTAELALALPAVVVVAVGLVWSVTAVGAGLRCQDAAREAARSVARGDATAAAVSLAHQVAPDGARVSVRSGGGVVRVDVLATVGPPGFGTGPGVVVSGSAVAALEQAVGGG